MLTVFSSIAPIFLLIVAGAALRRAPVFEAAFWTGLDRMGFYVLYPVLLFVTVLKADFGALALGSIMVALGGSLVLLAIAILVAWPLIFRPAGVAKPSFSSIFQSSIRWNGFIALAVAEKMFPAEGAAMVALVMAFAVIPINIASVTVVAWFGSARPAALPLLVRVLTTPLIVGTAAALLIRSLPLAMPDFLFDAFNLVGRAALGMGLLAIGAGLRIGDALRPNRLVFVPVFLKLLAFPLMVLGAALALGVPDAQLAYLALCASVPTAMNGYVLARQMGGDAEFYAATVTLQTAVAFFSIPVVLWCVAYLTGG